MEFIETEIQDLFIIKPKVFGDERGYFYESFNQKEFSKISDLVFVQDNQSMSNAGVLRGLHFQAPPFSQGKLVRVINGSVLDVVVDIRTKSKTFGKVFSIELTAENKTMLWIPPGFAHGFSTLIDSTIFQYKCTNYYNKDSEGCLLWNDKDLNIDWRIENPILSDKDKLGVEFSNLKSPF